MEVEFDLCLPPDTTALPSSPQPIAYLDPEEEIARGPACWLWDYLRRCGEAAGPDAWIQIPQHFRIGKIRQAVVAIPCRFKHAWRRFAVALASCCRWPMVCEKSASPCLLIS